MAPSFQTRDASRPRRSKTKPSTYAQSSSSPPRPKPKTKQTPKKGKGGAFYFTKYQAVLAEKLVKGRVLYLVNWADDPNTGEVYEATWEPRDHISPAGEEQWTQQKHEGLVVERGGELVLKDPNNDKEEAERSKRKRNSEINQSHSQSQEPGPSKKLRRAGAIETAISQSPSQGQAVGIAEVKDTYEDDVPDPANLPRRNSLVKVKVSVPVAFDSTACQTPFLIDSSQTQQSIASTQISQPFELSQDPTEDLSQPEFRRPKLPSRGPGRLVVPDSQDQEASETYEPSQLSKSTTTGLTQKSQFELESALPDIGESHREQSGIEESLDDLDLTYLGAQSSVNDFGNDSSTAETQGKGSVGQALSISSNLERNLSQPVQSRSLSENRLPASLTSQSSRLLTPVQENRASQDHFELSSSPSHPLQAPAREPQSSSYRQSQGQLLSPGEEDKSPKSVSDNICQSICQPPSPTKLNAKNSSQPDISNPQPSLLDPSDQITLIKEFRAPERSRRGTEEHLSTSESSFEITWPASKFILSTLPALAASRLVDLPLPAPATSQLVFVDRQISLPHSTLSGQQLSQSPFQGSELVLTSIETIEEAPCRQITESQIYWRPSTKSLQFSVSNMDESLKLAKRAERKRALEQKLKDDRERGIAEYAARTASMVPPSPSLEPTPALIAADLPPNETASDVLPIASPEEESLLKQETHFHSHTNNTFEAAQEVQIDDLDDQGTISEIEQLEIEDSGPLLAVVAETDSEYFLSLPLNSICREVYFQIIASARKERQDFLQDEPFGEDLLSKIADMVSNLDLLCSHSDLHSDDYSTQRMDPVAMQARFAENRSTKCIFVAELVQAMKFQEKHLAIIVRPGRMLEILEAVLEYHDFVKYPSTDRIEYGLKDVSESLKISVIASGLNASRYPSADLTIAFDSTFTQQPYLTALRTKPHTPALSPLVHLVVANSIEHLDKLFPTDIESIDRQGRIVGCLSVIKGDVGKVDTDPGQAAADIASFVNEGANPLNWPCQPLPIIEIAQEYAEDIRSNRSVAPSYMPVPGPMPVSIRTPLLPAVSKRQLDNDDVMDVDTPKRQRLTPALGEDNDSSLPSVATSSVPISQPPASSVDGFRASSRVEQQSSTESEARFSKEISDLKEQIQQKEKDEAQALRLIESLQAQVNDLRASVAVIQPKYQDALNERGEFESEAKLAGATSQRLKANFDSRLEELAKLKQQNEALNTELTEARGALANSTIPEISRVANLEENLRALEAEKEKWERQKQNSKNDLEYMRTNYQSASSAAAEHASANLALQSELETLREQASANKVKIHEIQRDQEKAGYLRMVKQLKIEKIELEMELKKKSNELAVAMNGRRGMRGQSAPMSPRMLSPMGPAGNGAGNGFGGQRGNLGRVLQQSRSRGTSPGGTERGTAGGGQQAFGELLPGVGSRFSEGWRRG